MPRFFTGDELGAIKSISYTQGNGEKEWKASTAVLVAGSSESGRSKTVQKLALHKTSESDALLAAVHADASAAVYRLQAELQPMVVHEWSEKRQKDTQAFVGLAATDKGIFSCTSNGALRLTTLEHEEGSEHPHPSFLSVLPTRLSEWRLSEGGEAFTYGGEEVELSLWETEKAFSQSKEDASNPPAEARKRKRGDQLLPGELWRAKNVPNDHLSLRQPVYNTALTFLQPASSPAHQHLLVGTAHGHVRRYDTRAARRPVSDWTGVSKAGRINAVERAFHEHEVFVSDQGSILSALDLRNGKTIYTYKGISGAVTSIASAQSFMASASRDRFVRFHSTFSPPTEVGQQQEHRGEVLDNLYMKMTPTVIIWDGVSDAGPDSSEPEDEAVDDVWDAMETVDSGSEDEENLARRKEETRTD